MLKSLRVEGEGKISYLKVSKDDLVEGVEGNNYIGVLS